MIPDFMIWYIGGIVTGIIASFGGMFLYLLLEFNSMLSKAEKEHV
jgi:hypothetical protein